VEPVSSAIPGARAGNLWTVGLTIDEGSRQVRHVTCSCCHVEAERTWANVREVDAVIAVYFASCYRHKHGVHEVFIDAILGTWSSGDFTDHVTFGCRVGPVAGSPGPAATLINGGTVAPDAPIFGRKLSREEGFEHPRLAEFWTIVDTILKRDELVHRHLYGAHRGDGLPPGR
jgi:hypothetical protein